MPGLKPRLLRRLGVVGMQDGTPAVAQQNVARNPGLLGPPRVDEVEHSIRVYREKEGGRKLG